MKRLFVLFGLSVSLLTAQTGHSVSLNWGWSQGTDGAAKGFSIKRALVTGGPYTVIGTVDSATTTSYVDISAAGNVLPEGVTYFYVVTATGPGGESAPSDEVSATIASIPPVTISTVVNGASFAAGVEPAMFQAEIVPNSWATILGTNLASTTENWNSFAVNGELPTTLDGVSVSIGGTPAFISYISPAQINVKVPDVGLGPQWITVTNSSQTSAAFIVSSNQYGPAFFSWPGNQAVATRQDFSFAAKEGTFPSVTTLPARPGEVIILWGTGFGPPDPVASSGIPIPNGSTYATMTPTSVTINDTPATVYGAALAPGFAGLYQVAIQVPNSLSDGDWPLQAIIGGVQSPTGIVLSVYQ
jgi:uncharacterized protein (TIGR03437 family)